MPYIEGNVLTVGCKIYKETDGKMDEVYYILHIDMENEKLASYEDGYGCGLNGGFMY